MLQKKEKRQIYLTGIDKTSKRVHILGEKKHIKVRAQKKNLRDLRAVMIDLMDFD
jgi:ribosomal protein L14E/L6E/L27E